MSDMIPLAQTVFARWNDGYYYPAVLDEVSENNAKVSFLDGDSGLVLKENIVGLQEAFQTMQIQGNWKNNGIFFNGRLDDSQEPIMMVGETPTITLHHFNVFRYDDVL